MANHKSSVKRAKQDLKKNARNSGTKKAIRTVEKKLVKAIESKSKDEANKLFVEFTSKIDKAATKGILHHANANRKKGRLSSRVSAI